MVKIGSLPFTISMFILSLAGCSQVPQGTSPTPIYPAPGLIPTLIYPTLDISSNLIYPAPGTPGSGTPLSAYSGFEPEPYDANLKRNQVLLDLSNSQLVMTATEPVQALAILKGNLSDPCHSLRVIVTPPDANNTINLEVYSVVDPTQACHNELMPFSAAIPLGSYSSGEYSVVVNGDTLGQFDPGNAPQPSGYEPQAGDANLMRDQAVLDMSGSQLVVTDTEPIQVGAILVGTLSDSCHSLRVSVDPPDSGGTISIMVYSVFDSNTACITAINPFTANIPLGAYTGGQYTVLVSAVSSGGLLGQFDATYAPKPEDDQLTRVEVTLDMSLTRLATTGGDWNLPAVNLQGYLPDSCHQLRIVVTPAYSEYRVDLEVYSVFDPQIVCTTVIQSFQVIYPLGGAGQSSVYVNGQFVGRFQWGG